MKSSRSPFFLTPSLISKKETYFSYNIKDRNEDKFLSMEWESASLQSRNLVDAILAELRSSQGWKYRPGEGIQKAAAAYAFGLLSVANQEKPIWLKRSLGQGTFTGQNVGYKPFIRLHKAMLADGLIEIKPGYYDRDSNGGGSGIVTRMRPTAAFLELALRYGVTSSNCNDHFKPRMMRADRVADPVIIKASKTGDWWNAEKGDPLPVDWSNDKIVSSVTSVNRINAYLSSISVEGCSVEGLYRLFNEGDHPGFDFDRGGRLYALGNYQRITKKARQSIRINGETVAEVDIAGSHLILLHAMLGAPLKRGFDPYAIDGLPRGVVKSFIVMTLGNGGFQRRWSLPIARKYLADHGQVLQDAYPLAAARDAILKHLPILRRWPDSGLSWADLQYRESCGLIAAVETLAYRHGVPALPLHDAVIVPVSKAELAASVMVEAFREHAGVDIWTTIKQVGDA